MHRLKPPADAFDRLRATEIFSIMDTEGLWHLSEELEWLHLGGGEILFRPGDPSDGMYIVIHGRLQVGSEDAEGRFHARGEIRHGESLGEMSLLSGESHNSLCRALRDSELVHLSRECFERTMGSKPEILRHLTKLIIRRLRGSRLKSNTTELRRLSLSLMAGSREAPAPEFARCLAATLESAGQKVRVLDRAIVESALFKGATDLGPDDGRHHELVGWLSEQEARHETLLYVADPAPTAWTRRCLRQTGHAILVVEPGMESTLGAYTEARRLEGLLPRAELVLLHPPAAQRPSGTSRWLDRGPFEAHHHVVWGPQPDLGRVVRRLTGQALGLVMGGGGARGFAHIGVMRAIREAGFEIDRTGGSSMGAVIAAECALGWEWKPMVEANRRALVNERPFRDFTLPFISICSGGDLRRTLRDNFGGIDIEDLWIPYFCQSSDLSTGKPVVHTRGELHEALRASTAIPGIQPPAVQGGHLLVDGAVLDNLPVRTMREMGEGPVLASDVTPHAEFEAGSRHSEAPGPWAFLLDRLRRKKRHERFPGIIRILMRSALLPGIEGTEGVTRMADLVIAPPLGTISMFDWDSIDRSVEIGFEHTLREVKRWAAARARRDPPGPPSPTS
ncbi:MAG: patatin-like phospholipase family protein [Planctomycetota bacterium]